MSKMKKYTVYIPSIYSEVYHDVEATSLGAAIAKAMRGDSQCHGEIITGNEDKGPWGMEVLPARSRPLAVEAAIPKQRKGKAHGKRN